MIQPIFRKLFGAFCLALLLLALPGCGRRGPPELPPDATTPAPAPGAAAPGPATSQTGYGPGAPPEPPAPSSYGSAPIGPSLDSTMTQSPTAAQAPSQRPSNSVYPSFVLDPLLK